MESRMYTQAAVQSVIVPSGFALVYKTVRSFCVVPKSVIRFVEL